LKKVGNTVISLPMFTNQVNQLPKAELLGSKDPQQHQNLADSHA
jgi:hypothetical protein